MGPALPAAETLMPLAACVYLSADRPILLGAAYPREGVSTRDRFYIVEPVHNKVTASAYKTPTCEIP